MLVCYMYILLFCMQIVCKFIVTMKRDYEISLWLDPRRKLKSGKFPVKLRVYTQLPIKSQKLFATKFEFSEDEFSATWLTTKPRKKYKETRAEMQALVGRANEIAKQIQPFNIETFEKKIYRKAGAGIRLQYQFQQVIKELKKYERFGSASSYDLTEKAIREFSESRNTKYENLTFYDITVKWLTDFEHYLTVQASKKRSLTTVGIYARTLRAVYNRAINEGEISKDFYPFLKYEIPRTRKVKKALSKEELKQLFDAPTSTPWQEKAKDFFFLSFSCSGINLKDLAYLRYRDIQDDRLTFVRAKTRLTSKGNQKAITVYLNDFAKQVIQKYGNPDITPENFIFDIIRADQSAEVQRKKIIAFLSMLNQSLKHICKVNGLPETISFYTARHSYATTAIRSGVSMEFVSEALGHNNITTTQAYFAGFDDQSKKEFAETLMNFE